MENNKNYLFFKNEEKRLSKQYPNEFIIICNEEIVFHNMDLNKIMEFARELEAGTYIIQKCENNEANSIQTFHTRVTF